MSAPAANRSATSSATGDGEVHRELGLVGVVLVGGLLAHRERAGQRDLDRAVGARPQELEVLDLDRPRAPHRADHARHRVRPAGPPGHHRRVVDVEALERRREAVRVALAADLAVGDHVEPGALLREDRERRRVVLRPREVRLRDPPELLRPHPRRQRPAQLLAVDEPVRLRVAPDDGRGQERQHPPEPRTRSRSASPPRRTPRRTATIAHISGWIARTLPEAAITIT